MESIIEHIKKFFVALNGRLVRWYRKLPEGKKYVEFITALLSVPVMITVIILNMNNLNQNKQNALKVAPTTAPIEVVITTGMSRADDEDRPSRNTQDNLTPTMTPTLTPTPTVTLTPTPTSIVTPTAVACIKEVGSVEVVTPQEGQVFSNNNFCIKISRNSKYCGATMAYQLDDSGSYSDYTSSSICLYNLSNGVHSLQLKIKSTESDDSVTLKRSFTIVTSN